MKNIFLTLNTLFFFTVAFAQVQLRPAKIFSDSMVLQRGIKIPVWGWASADEKVYVLLNKQVKTVNAGKDGKWKVNFEPEKEGGPYKLTIRGKANLIELKDVLIGDVWICSGQSNMEFALRSANNGAAEIAAANNPRIRHIKIGNMIGERPMADLVSSTGWKPAVPAFAGDFTAVGYFFAKELYAQLNVPIGLINTTWGGTDVETWTSREAFQKSDEFREMISRVPTINIDSFAMLQQKKMKETIMKVQGPLASSPSIVTQWTREGFNDNNWPKMKVPGLWEEQNLPELDGVVWFRKIITLTKADIGKAAELSLGMIDDNDVTYVNGVIVGKTNGYNVNRRYKIAGGLLKEGKNVIAVKVEDTGGGGGLYGDADSLKLTINGQKQSLAGNWSFQVESIGKSNSMSPNSYPTLLYNAMINPLIPFGIKGAIWYQGENNAGRAYQYRKAFPLMISDWRERWGQGDFPFYFVQLASYNAGNGTSEKGSNWAELREAQTLTLSLPNTGMAVTTDIGESKDIHPKNKLDVGKRLAATALYNTYGKKDIVYSGPVYKSMKVDSNKAVVSFTNTGKGLFMKNKPLTMADSSLLKPPSKEKGQMANMSMYSVKGFEIAGADKKFYPAIAEMQQDRIIVYSEKVTIPVAVRYAWADDAGTANLYNREGFPAVPFRTDNWKGITDGAKYRGL